MGTEPVLLVEIEGAPPGRLPPGWRVSPSPGPRRVLSYPGPEGAWDSALRALASALEGHPASILRAFRSDAPDEPPEAGEIEVVGGLRISFKAAPTAEEPWGGVRVRLSPGRAFGTGMHPSTRASLLALSGLRERGLLHGRSVLDVGTGTGILAISALLLGCTRALGIDIDPDAVREAAENARLNRLEGRFLAARAGPEAVRPGWDLILANLAPSVVDALAPILLTKLNRGGLILAAGPKGRPALGLTAVLRAVCEGWEAAVWKA